MEFTTYTTKNGDRWDTVARLYYGVPSMCVTIMMDNLNVMLYTIFPDGVVLRIRIIETSDPLTTESLPPWMQE